MSILMNKKFNPLKQQRGFSLIEALVAFLVLSVGMLGIASLQVISLKAGAAAVNRSMVVIKVEEILERIRNNPTQVSSYATASATGANQGCNDYSTVTSCTPARMALDDTYRWIEDLKARMPNTSVTASIQVIAPTPGVQPASTVTVTVNWNERSTETQTLDAMSYSTTAFICPSIAC